MADEARLLLAFGLAAGAAFAATPVAIAVATRTGFHDHPVGYKGHRAPTPYLGGAAVVAAFLLAGATVGGELSRLSPIVACAFAMWCLGTVDDKVNLAPSIRLAVGFGTASALWAFDLGWSVFDVPAADLLLTNLWVVGLANAFNLMDNMDGAAVTVAAVTALATGVMAVLGGDIALAVLCAGMAGACLGFLPYNLAGPARIFLGDGGSLPIGFVVAATIMALPDEGDLGSTRVLAAVILAGLPVIDTLLVLVSRRRAEVPFLTGGRDHLTHRLATRLGSARAVAVALGCAQALLGSVAIGVVEMGEGSIVVAWVLWFVAAAGAVILFETASWLPERDPPVATAQAPATRAAVAAQGTGPGPGSPSLVEGGLIVFITAACGLSPALYGFYSLSVWGPIALLLLASLLGLVVARPAAPRPMALVALGGLVFLWLWSLASGGWAESSDQALLEANRWMLYASLFAILVLLLRDERLGKLLLASAAGVVLAFGVYLVVRLLGSDGPSMFLGKRLHEPLGYVNGQAGYLLLGVWPLVAAAERLRNHALSGTAISGAVLLAGVALLGQTRAIVPAVVVSAIVLVAAVPGRRARLWALLAIAAGVGLAAGPLLDVFNSGPPGPAPGPDVLRTGVLALLGSSAAAGVIWAGVRWMAERSEGRFGETRLRALSTGLLALLVASALAAGLVAVGDPVDRARDELNSFRNLDTGSQEGSRSRFTSGGGNRYDYFRVAWHQFTDEPAKGIGAGNYDRTYFLERETTEDVRQPHSLPLQTLAELGLVGGLGLLAFLGALGAGFARRVLSAGSDPSQLGIAVAGGGMVLVWLVHTSVDWLHLIPGVTGIALCGAAALVAPWRSRGAYSSRSPVRLAAIAVCALVVVFGAAMVGRSALSDKYRSDSQEVVRSDPAEALAKAKDSLELNDEALPAYYAKATALARMNDYPGARAALAEATRREPHDFVTWALLGDLAVRRGDFRQARSDYGRAAALNPRDVGLKQLAQDPRSALER